MFWDRLLSYPRYSKEWLPLLWLHCKQFVSKVVLRGLCMQTCPALLSPGSGGPKVYCYCTGQYVSTCCIPSPHPHGPSGDSFLWCRVALLSEYTVSAKFGELQPYPLELIVAVSKGKHACLSLFCLWTNILGCPHQAWNCIPTLGDPALTVCSVSPGVDLIAAFYGCLYCGCVPVTVRPPHPQNLGTTLPTVKMIVEVSSLFWQAMSSWVGSWHLSCMVFILCRMKLT